MLRPVLTVLLSAAIVAGGAAIPATADDPGPSILINELTNGGPQSTSDGFFELRNWGTETVDLTGWQVFRCSPQGLRSNIGRPEAELAGVVLDPGEIFTVSRVGMPGDAHTTAPYPETGFGIYLEGPDDQLVDAVGVYPNEPWQTESECTNGRNLANRLDFAASESWQRVSATGDPAREFIVAPSTIAQPNRSEPTPRADASIVISEVASAGPAGSDDEFIELENVGTSPQSLDGWLLYRCTAFGRTTPETLELTMADDTTLAPGERLVIGGHGFTGEARATLRNELANVTFGVMLRTETGALVDRIAASHHNDSACQDGDAKLAAVLDAVAGESYQRADGGFIVAPRTPGASNATVAASVFEPFSYESRGVAVSELATDPAEGPTGTRQQNYIELANYGAAAVDVSGWTIRRCQFDGTRAFDLQATIPGGTSLAPGETWLAARAGTDAAAAADATYPDSLNFLGTGVWLEDAAGTRIDSVGVYATNELDSSNVTPSPCTKGMALTVYQPDRMLAETFHRSRFTGSDADDFLVAPATPGLMDELRWVDPTARVVTSEPAALPDVLRAHAKVETEPTAAATVLEAWGGVSDVPLVTRTGEGETALDPTNPGATADSAWGLPYQRLVLDASALAAGSLVGWQGATVEGGEVQLRVWSGDAWRLLDAGGSGILSGELVASDIVDGRVELLVQDGPRAAPTVTTERDGLLEDPDDYDFAITHITDTQYLTESYPEVYAQLASWLADNAEERKIEFAAHTGDLVQNWVDPDQNEERARIEFERASSIQSILDDAGVPNSVLPGNHDNKRGVTNELFNEYFPPSRYEGTPWYGGSIGPDDNSSNFSTFEVDGTKMLVLNLPYAYGEAELAWAEQVVTSHPDYNVVVATHEHIMPKKVEEQAHRATNARWISRAGDLWDRVIAPNRNVVVVLSGHFHGLGQVVTENAGGIEGHTVTELLADYQEFRTHSGERATGFYRMLQIDVDGGVVAVDTRSIRLAASYSYSYDYRQFVPENGSPSALTNARPWNLIDAGTEGRYTEADDEFTARLQLQHPKLVDTDAVLVG